MCGCAADLTWSGGNDLLFGTFGQQVLAYTSDPEPVRSAPGDDAQPSTEMAAPAPAPAPARFRRLWTRQFAAPVYDVGCLDMTGDGTDEVVVLTS